MVIKKTMIYIRKVFRRKLFTLQKIKQQYDDDIGFFLIL